MLFLSGNEYKDAEFVSSGHCDTCTIRAWTRTCWQWQGWYLPDSSR